MLKEVFPLQENEKRNIKIVIIILSVLLAVSLLCLAGTLLYNHFFETQPVSVTVPDNIITPEKEETNSLVTDNSETGTADENSNSSTSETATSSASATSQSGADVTATALSLHNRNTQDNTPFQVGNMFPGDSETKYYCVRVSHKGDVLLRFNADIRPDYEQLAKVLCCCITLPEKGEVLYDGLMRDMPKSLNLALNTDKSTTSEVYYEITAYLDTSVGNEYMNKDLIVDFRWWVEETGNLDSPQTGDAFNIYLWLCIAAGSLFLLILLLKKRKKEDAVNER
nr:MAG TPA: Spore coat-associated protein N, biofilm matrix, amyloid fiber [Caudoviricetes sp.]